MRANIKDQELAVVHDGVAAALDMSPRHVTVGKVKLSPGGRSLRSWGLALGRPYFSKTLLCDPYPVIPHVAIPWDDAAFGTVFRSSQEQVETEWSTTLQLRRLTGADHVAAPMGKSVVHRTLVWEDVGGVRLDDQAKRLRLLDSKLPASTEAMRQAGQWLRELHDHSAHGSATIDLARIVERMQDRIAQEGQALSGHGKKALKMLERAFRASRRGELKVPVVLSHGDFMLANLRWNSANSRMYVVDFENFAPASLCQDLLSIAFDLRSQLLNPLLPRQAVRSLEKAFWAGYGGVEEEVLFFVHGIASARVLYYHLPQALKKRNLKGGIARATASVYKTLLAPSMLARCVEEN